MKLSEVTSQLVITQTGTTVNPIPAAPAKDTYGTVTYTNNGNAVGAFNLSTCYCHLQVGYS